MGTLRELLQHAEARGMSAPVLDLCGLGGQVLCRMAGGELCQSEQTAEQNSVLVPKIIVPVWIKD